MPSNAHKPPEPQQNFLKRWEQIKTANASGIGLREIARELGDFGRHGACPRKARRLDATDSISGGTRQAQRQGARHYTNGGRAGQIKQTER